MAEVEGDMEKVEDLRLELEDLEDRAKELDSMRTSTISAIRSIHNHMCTHHQIALHLSVSHQADSFFHWPPPVR